MKGFFLKVFGVVLVIHILVLGFLWLRHDDDDDLDSLDAVEPISGVVPLDEAVATPPQAAVSQPAAKDNAPVPATASQPGLYPLDVTQGVDLDSVPHENANEIRTGILVDADTGRVLFELNSQEPVPIASMTKMMTALLAFEEVEDNPDLSFDTMIQVTNDAYKIGGSQVWLDPRESFSLRELLISIMVKSANDSAYLVGEYIAGGNMPLFVKRMNTRAKELHMGSARFLNAHGLTSNSLNNLSSCEDLVYLAEALLKYDRAIEWANMPLYTFRASSDKPTILRNHNQLVVTSPGVDGLKTGYTRDAGFCVTATCKRDGRRLIAVVTGFLSEKRRNDFTARLFDWGFEQIEQ